MKFILKYFIFLIIIPTIIIVVVNPTMHKQIIIAEPNTIQIITTTKTENNIQKKQKIVVNTTNTNSKTVQNTTKVKTQTPPQKKTKEVRTDVFTNYPTSTDNIQTKTKINSSNQISPKKKSQTNINTVKYSEPVKKVTQNVQQKPTNSKTDKKTVTQTSNQTKPQVKTITPQEEIIAWNQWNANIRNKLLSDLASMRNKHLIILKSGSNYAYSFRVSRAGVISNINVHSSDSSTEGQKVKSAIESLIKSYSGTSILTFPTGSQKTYYDVSSNIAISRNIKQDTSAKASDFSVYEKIKK